MVDDLSHAVSRSADRRDDMKHRWIDTGLATVIVALVMTSTIYSIVIVAYIPA